MKGAGADVPGSAAPAATAVPPGAAERVRGVVVAVVRQALADAGARRVAVQDATTPAGTLLLRWLAAEGVDAAPAGAGVPGADVLEAHPTDKTRLLLAAPPPGAALLPFGDLWGSRLAALAAAPAVGEGAVAELAVACGGQVALDAALARWIDDRDPPEEALAGLPATAAAAVRAAFDAGRVHRRRAGLVPKLGGRTVGIDLFD